MIENKKQYELTLDMLADFKRSLKLAKKLEPTIEEAWLVKATLESIQSEIDVLQEQVKEYEEENQIGEIEVAQPKFSGEN
jgi:predicted nuclease with TOPRIM domain